MKPFKMTAVFQDKVIAEATFSGTDEDALSIQRFFGLANWGGMVLLDIRDCSDDDVVCHVKARGE